MEMYRFSSSKVPLFNPMGVAFRLKMYHFPGKNSEPGLYTRILKRSYQSPLVLFLQKSSRKVVRKVCYGDVKAKIRSQNHCFSTGKLSLFVLKGTAFQPQKCCFPGSIPQFHVEMITIPRDRYYFSANDGTFRRTWSALGHQKPSFFTKDFTG